MPFDDDLTRTLDGLADRLRDEVGRQLASTAEALRSAAAADRRAAAFDAAASARAAAEDEADQRVAEADQRAAEATQRAGEAAARAAAAAQEAEGRAREAGVEEGREAGRREGRDEGRAEGREAAAERLLDGIRALDRARSLGEILDTLVGCAAREAARAGVLLVQGERLKTWRLMGFLDRDQPTAPVPLAAAGVLADVVATATVSSSETPDTVPPSFAQLPRGRAFFGTPIAIGGDVVAVLYADEGPDERREAEAAEGRSRLTSAAWRAAVEALARHAARCLESITAIRAAQLGAGGSRHAGRPAEDAEPAAAKGFQP
jgi:hypothetical protein